EAQRYQIFQVFRQRVFRRGYLPELAKQQYFDCFNALPHSEWYLGAIFGKEPSRRQMSQYKQHLATVGQRRGKSIAWIVEEFEKEFGVGSWQNAA
ncbi:MAG: helicase SNF2, partial [Synechococcales cyanobacterium RU_4_20]|nr:helicase SNF2 [Synechococcales cyanobacterium RU_4_20]